MSSDVVQRGELIEKLGETGRQLSTWTVLFHQALAARVGLNVTDHKSLEILLETGPVTAGKLAELTGLTSGAITGVVDRLERLGIVERRYDPSDRRRVIVQPLEENALRVLGPLFEDLAAGAFELNSSYSDEELVLILGYLDRCVELMRAQTALLREKRPD